jgi:hypothetical protein
MKEKMRTKIKTEINCVTDMAICGVRQGEDESDCAEIVAISHEEKPVLQYPFKRISSSVMESWYIGTMLAYSALVRNSISDSAFSVTKLSLS